MRKADLKKNHNEFDNILRWYYALFERLLRKKSGLEAGDKREIAESILLRLCAYWESFVEKELVDCTNIDSFQLAQHVGVSLPKHLPLATCEAILIGSRYLNWHGINELKGLAKKVLPAHVNPFAKITKATGLKIDEAYVIRNYLSHQSRAAHRTLMTMYRTKYGLTYFREPGVFLLANRGRRLIAYGQAFTMASEEMAQIIP